MPVWLIVIVVGSLLMLAAVGGMIRLRNMHYWLRTYIDGWRVRASRPSSGTTVYVCVADHFEPFGGSVDRQQAEARVQRWMSIYPQIAARHGDSLGNPPKHTFFYPLEDYDADTLDKLADLSARGFGDVEVHYHHDGDTAEKLESAITKFKETLRHRHGLLRTEGPGAEIVYCFIHGNWALDNSRPDGRWCGVNDELSVLLRTGCRVDFTMPSAPDDTQTRKINSIYFAKGRAGHSKSHDDGRDVAVRKWGAPDELLLVQGPLGLNWRSRKFGLIPRIENGEISADAPPSASRVRLWWRLAPRIGGAEQHVFIKLHTHGAPEATSDALLGGGLETLWDALETEFRDRADTTLRYVTAWEMYCIIRELAVGKESPAEVAKAS